MNDWVFGKRIGIYVGGFFEIDTGNNVSLIYSTSVLTVIGLAGVLLFQIKVKLNKLCFVGDESLKIVWIIRVCLFWLCV